MTQQMMVGTVGLYGVSNRYLRIANCWKSSADINVDSFPIDIPPIDLRDGVFPSATCVSQAFLLSRLILHVSAVLDPASQVWWRWANVMFTLLLWSVELVVSPDGDDVSTKWKVE